MTNPCKECIVKPMCKSACNVLIMFFKDNVIGYQLHGYKSIAQAYKKGNFVLVKNSNDNAYSSHRIKHIANLYQGDIVDD